MLTFYLWPGCGYNLQPFEIEEANENEIEEAFELLAKKLIEDEKTAYFLTPEQYDKVCEGCSENELDSMEDQYLYVDGTCSGAAYPVYILTENIAWN